MPAVAAEPASPTDVYRREARRLRCRYAGQPGQLHASLKRLAGTGSNPSPAGRRARPQRVMATPCYPGLEAGEPARRFRAHLAGQVTSHVLRYSQRLELLRAARRFGVGRFEANLLIALVLERRRTPMEARTEAGGIPVALQVLIFCLFQVALLAGAWWTFLR